MNSNDPDKETLDAWNKDPNNWYFGVFYFNKKDKRLLPPKRVPMLGWTINFANPLSILISVILTAIIILLIRFIK